MIPSRRSLVCREPFNTRRALLGCDIRITMEHIRFQLDNQYVCLEDACGFLLDIKRPQNQNRLTHIAEDSGLPRLSHALQREGALFQTKGDRSKKWITLPFIANAVEFVWIIRELLSHYSRTGTRGTAASKLLVVLKRSDELLANFATTFLGLWVECDIHQLYTTIGPIGTTQAHTADLSPELRPDTTKVFQYLGKPKNLELYLGAEFN